MKFIDLLVQELPKRGGWPEGAVECERYLHEAQIAFYDKDGNWGADCGKVYGDDFAAACVKPRKKGNGFRTERVTREQYEAALAAAQQLVWDGEGLPPVGTEFEFGDHRSKARCLGVGLTMVFACWGDPKDEDGDYEEFLISVAHSKFYPVRTEEELMQETIETSLRTCLAGTGAGITELAAKNLYQAIANGSIPGVGLVKNN